MKNIDEIYTHLRNRDFDKARRTYGYVLSRHSNTSDRLALARLSYAMTDVTRAQDFAEEALQTATGKAFWVAARHYVKIACAVGNRQAADPIFRRMLKRDPTTALSAELIEGLYYMGDLAQLEEALGEGGADLIPGLQLSQYFKGEMRKALTFDIDAFKEKIQFDLTARYFVNTSGTGELFYAACCAEHLIAAGSDVPTFIVEEKHAGVMECFTQLFPKIIVVDQGDISKYALHKNAAAFAGRLLNTNPKFLLCESDGRIRDDITQPGILENDFTTNLERQKVGMGIALETSVGYQRKDLIEATPFEVTPIDVTGRPRVLLSPFARSLQTPNKVFWDALVAELGRQGFDTVVSVGPDDKPEQVFTNPPPSVDFGHGELFDVLGGMAGFIGARSGLCDMVVFSDTPACVLYARPEAQAGTRFAQFNSWSLTVSGDGSAPVKERVIYPDARGDAITAAAQEVVRDLMSMIVQEPPTQSNLDMNHAQHGQSVLTAAAQALVQMAESLDHTFDFDAAVKLILDTQGTVVITGIGKSGHVGKKLAASLASTGTPSFFVHCAEASHGDLGMIRAGDVVLAISSSGASRELFDVLGYCQLNEIPLIGVTKKPDSPLGQAATLVLRLPDLPEAGHLGIAPTTSTTATIALGDALAMAVATARQFGADDFLKFHPGGKLGQDLSNSQTKEN